MIPTVTLPHDVSVRDAADACRAALEEFAALEPTHFAVAHWLSTSYRNALIGSREPWPFVLRVSTPIECVITAAQAQLAELRRRARDPSGDFVAELPTRVNIARTRDVDGHSGFGPIDVRGAPLAARVLSLLLADYLARPEDYLATTAA